MQHWEVGNSEPSLDDAVVISNILETSPFWILMGLHVRIDKSAEKQPAASKGSSPPILSFVPFASSPQATQLRMASKLVGRAAPTFSGIESNTARVSISTRVLAGPLGVIFTRTTCSSDVIGIIAGEPNENLDLIPGDTLIVDRAASLKFGYIVLASINGRGAFGILSRDKNDDIRISRTGKSEPIIGAGDISKLPRHINFTDEERAVKSYVIGVVMEVSRRMIQLDGKPRPAKGE